MFAAQAASRSVSFESGLSESPRVAAAIHDSGAEFVSWYFLDLGSS
jgi:hypothetical protein